MAFKIHLNLGSGFFECHCLCSPELRFWIPCLGCLKSKKVYSYTGPFIEHRVSEFLDQVVKKSAVGRQIDDYPSAEFIDAWDGKDGTRSGDDDDDDILAELRKQREKQEADTEAVNYYASSGSKKYKNKKNAKKKKSHDDDDL